MKQLEYTHPAPDKVGLFVIAVTKYSKYKLTREDDFKWIFRDINKPQWGLSGHHRRRDECVNSALSNDCKCFEFETELEMLNWLKTNENS